MKEMTKKDEAKKKKPPILYPLRGALAECDMNISFYEDALRDPSKVLPEWMGIEERKRCIDVWRQALKNEKRLKQRILDSLR